MRGQAWAKAAGGITKLQISVYPVHDERQQIVAVQATMRSLEAD